MNPTTITLQVGKFYRSRDGRIWEVVEKVPEDYSKEKDGSRTRNAIYPFIALCHSTKTYNTFATNGRSHLNYMELDEDLIEELSGVFAHERKIQFKSADDKRFVRSNGKLYCVNSSDEVCTYLYEELPPELKGVWRVQSTTIKNFTYEDYCKFYGIQPVYEKKANRKEQFKRFIQDEKNFEFLGCQKENYGNILNSFFNFYELIEGQKMKVDFFTELMVKMDSEKNIDTNKFNVSLKEKDKLTIFFNKFRSILKAEK